MISSPQFISLHTQHALLSNSISPSNTNQMIVRRYSKSRSSEMFSVQYNDLEFTNDEDIKIEYPFRFDVRFEYKIVGSCNGLICLLGFPSHESDSIQLWNPAIKRKLRLPVSQTSSEECILGFGFDDRNNDYKVVRMCFVEKYDRPPIRIVEVYSLSRGNWHTVENGICRNYVVGQFWSQVFIHGNLHWTAYKNVGQNKLKNMIMLFNVSLEVFDEMPLPESLENEPPINLCGVDLGGSLAVVRYEDGRLRSWRCWIWVMKNYGDAQSWSVNYNVYLGDSIGTILGVRRNGDVLMTSRNGGLVLHSRLTGKNVDLVTFGKKHSFYVGPYFESLVLLDGIGSESDEECVSLIEYDPIGLGFADSQEKETWIQNGSLYLETLLRSLDG